MLGHGRAVFRRLPSVEAAIDSGVCGDPDHEGTHGSAKKMLKACQKAKNQLERLFGPLWTPTDQSFADAAALADNHPKLRLAASPDFSMAHWACSMGEPGDFATQMRLNASKSRCIETLKACHSIAVARAHGHLIQMCEALAERESISSETPSARAKSKATKTI